MVSGGEGQGQEGITVPQCHSFLLPHTLPPTPSHPGICSIHSPGRERRVRTRGEEPWTAGEVMLAPAPGARWERTVTSCH